MPMLFVLIFALVITVGVSLIIHIPLKDWRAILPDLVYKVLIPMAVTFIIFVLIVLLF